ncbi:MAG: GxxExxY protein [Burkholderiales bacterium]
MGTADERRSMLDQITRKVIGCIHQVSNALGAGFLERVYENALVLELREVGFEVSQQHGIEVRYKEVVVGDFVADLLVENCVVVEIKAVKALDEIHAAQCLNYLRATGLQVCRLVNFGVPRAAVRRIVHNC